MSLKYISDLLENIKSTSGTNDKIRLLSEYLKDDTFLKVVVFAYSDSLHYGVKEIPLVPKREFNKEELFSFLVTLSNQKGTSNADKGKLAELCSVDVETKKVVHKIINKDLRINAGAKTINSARPDTVYIEPYQRCSTEKMVDRITYPAIVQEKADGIFVNIKIYKDGKIDFISRSGKKVHQLDKLKTLLQNKIPEKFWDIVLHGEVLIKIDGKILDRQTGNGILNSCLNNTADQKLADCAVLKIWDIVPMKAYNAHFFDLDYIKRFKRCRRIVKLVKHKSFMCIRTKIINSYEEAQTFYKLIRDLGGEGAILKNFKVKWKNHTSPGCTKLKNVVDLDLRLIDWKKGKKDTRFENCMGALICESECGKLQVSVGTGFSDKEREENWDKEIGSIITVSCESIIKDKSKTQYSLYLPRFDTLRPDRNDAQTLKDMQTR